MSEVDGNEVGKSADRTSRSDYTSQRPVSAPRETARPTPDDVAMVSTRTDMPDLPEVSEAFGALATGVALVAPDLRIVAVNDALAESLGADARHFTGHLFWELLPEGSAAPEAEMILATARDGAPRSCCSTINSITLEFRCQRISSGFVVIEATDSTVQAKLERHYDHLLESITDGLCVLDARWRLTYWNAAAERMTGMRAADLLNKGVSVAFGNMVGSQLAARFIETLRRNSPTEIRSWSYAGDGHGRAAGIYDAFIYPVEGGGAVVIFREVGERVRQEREILERRSEAEVLHALVRSIAEVSDSSELRNLLARSAMERCNARGSIVIEVLGSDGVITAVAGDSTPLLGTRIPLTGSLTERAMLEGSIVEVADYASEYPEHQKRLLGQLLGPVLATSLVAHDQRLGVLIVSRAPRAEPFSAREKEHLGVIADHASLGLWKLRLVDQAHAANQAKSDFMATMSHELRTPLAALTGYGEILAEQVAGPLSNEQLDVVERMRSVTNHLAVLIDEILTYSSLDSGKEVARFVEVPLENVIREAVAVVEPLARQKGITFEYDVASGVRLLTDPDKVRQILVHLLGNAIKFTERGGVRLATSRDSGWLRLSIEDTGIGIADENRSRLFQPFTQLDAGLRRRHRGAGLGLFISQRLAQLLGGAIDFYSTIGKGSAFTVSIPDRTQD